MEYQALHGFGAIRHSTLDVGHSVVAVEVVGALNLQHRVSGNSWLRAIRHSTLDVRHSVVAVERRMSSVEIAIRNQLDRMSKVQGPRSNRAPRRSSASNTTRS